MKKILVVDDDRDTRLLLQVILRKDGYDVKATHDGHEALAYTANERPDLVIVDALMPGLDGFGTLKELRANTHTSDIPVVMLSAQTEDTEVLRAWREGVDLYLEKPFDPKDLTAYIRRIFQERRTQSDRRSEQTQSERRVTQRRFANTICDSVAENDKRSGDRRVADRRATSRRLDFAEEEAT